ncbi:MFS transporter [Piscibacillus salipiscarius]|uniref:MFS transporter n=1 Tax=Piscibacillus salipiscarius TaxID=299480 RepID=A0ABW5QBX4_9BACI|nr:MFS transporter [Piscibacillus salipiscarius]
MDNWKVWKKESEYHKLFFSGVINGIGNRFTQVAILALIYDITNSAFAIGLLFLIRLLPFLMMAPLAGALADRLSKKTILLTTELIRVPIVLWLILGNNLEQLWIIYVSSFLLALGEAVYAPTRKALIPNLVRRDHLLSVNAIEQIIMGLVLIIGSTTGGFISYLLGNNIAFSLNALTFLMSAIFLKYLKMPNRQLDHSVKPPSPAISYKKFLKSPALFVFLFICLTMPIANGIDNVLISVYALEVFNMGDLGVGLIYGGLGIGIVLSSFSSHWIKGNLVGVTVLFIIFEGIGHFLLSVSPTFPIALGAVLVMTFSGGVSNISFDTLVMKTVPSHRQGTFFGLTEMISNVTLGAFIAIGGLILEFIEPRILGSLVGLLYFCLAIIYLFLFKRINLLKEKRKLRDI